jgi:hypothetical protein
MEMARIVEDGQCPRRPCHRYRHNRRARSRSRRRP